jgi:hypothetical protein
MVLRGGETGEDKRNGFVSRVPKKPSGLGGLNDSPVLSSGVEAKVRDRSQPFHFIIPFLSFPFLSFYFLLFFFWLYWV